MNELLCVQVLSNAGETDSDFFMRLDDFWDLAHYSLAQAVYAAATRLEDIENKRARSYLVERDMALTIEKEMSKTGFDVLPVDTNSVFAPYEAVSPEWIVIAEPDNTDTTPPIS